MKTKVRLFNEILAQRECKELLTRSEVADLIGRSPTNDHGWAHFPEPDVVIFASERRPPHCLDCSRPLQPRGCPIDGRRNLTHPGQKAFQKKSTVPERSRGLCCNCWNIRKGRGIEMPPRAERVLSQQVQLWKRAAVDAYLAVRDPTPMAQWWSWVRQTEDGHWIWQGPVHGKGHPWAKYGRVVGRFEVWKNGVRQSILAHKFGYENLVGKVPPDYCLRSTCAVPRCVNPAHYRLAEMGSWTREQTALDDKTTKVIG